MLLPCEIAAAAVPHTPTPAAPGGTLPVLYFFSFQNSSVVCVVTKAVNTSRTRKRHNGEACARHECGTSAARTTRRATSNMCHTVNSRKRNREAENAKTTILYFPQNRKRTACQIENIQRHAHAVIEMIDSLAGCVSRNALSSIPTLFRSVTFICTGHTSGLVPIKCQTPKQ